MPVGVILCIEYVEDADRHVVANSILATSVGLVLMTQVVSL